MNVARQAALAAGLPVSVPAATINRVCGSGLQAVVQAVDALQTGYVELVVAGGTESMSRAPFLVPGARWGYRLGPWRAGRLDPERRPDLRDRVVPHGQHGRGDRAALRHLARGAGRVRRREPGPRRCGDRPRGSSRPRSCRSRRLTRKGHGDRVAATSTRGRAPRVETLARAAAGVRQERHGHRRQRVRASTTARRRVVVTTAERARRARRRAARAGARRTPSTGVEPDGHGHGTGVRRCGWRCRAPA